MRYSKLFTAVVVAILLGAASLVPVANANSDEIVQTAGGVSYVSGGVGTASIDRLSSLARDFNLKLVFALKSGEYVSGVRVAIADAAGKTLLDTTSEGPWFLTKLPVGNYRIVATFAGNAEKRTIAVGAAKLRTIDFRWGSE
jgi:outer membrane murein-binding lipoprotein Lpp